MMDGNKESYLEPTDELIRRIRMDAESLGNQARIIREIPIISYRFFQTVLEREGSK